MDIDVPAQVLTNLQRQVQANLTTRNRPIRVTSARALDPIDPAEVLGRKPTRAEKKRMKEHRTIRVDFDVAGKVFGLLSMVSIDYLQHGDEAFFARLAEDITNHVIESVDERARSAPV